MNRFDHSKDDFTGWDKDEPKRQAFLGRLLSIIKRRTRFRSACPCLPEIMSMLNAIYPLHETGRNAYVLCGLSVIELVGEWAKVHLEPDVVVKFVFEAGANGAGRLITDMDRLGRLSEISFLKKCDVGALQAADLDAYEQGNFLGDIEKWI